MHSILQWMAHNPKVFLVMLAVGVLLGIIAWARQDQVEYERDFKKSQYRHLIG